MIRSRERLDEGMRKTAATTSNTTINNNSNSNVNVSHSITDIRAIPPSPSVEPRVYGAASERASETRGNRAINNYRMKKGARYPPGAPKPRLHTPHRPLPSRATPAPYKPRARARPRQLYPRTRNVLLP